MGNPAASGAPAWCVARLSFCRRLSVTTSAGQPWYPCALDQQRCNI